MKANELRRIYARLGGRTIVGVEPHLSRADNAGVSAREDWTSDPTFRLEDGSTLSFIVDETETGEYGIRPVLANRPARKAPSVVQRMLVDIRGRAQEEGRDGNDHEAALLSDLADVLEQRYSR